MTKRPGDRPPTFSAREWNRAVDAARAWRDSQFDQTAGPSVGDPQIWIRNDTGSDRDRGDVVAVAPTPALSYQSGSPGDLRRVLVLSGVLPHRDLSAAPAVLASPAGVGDTVPATLFGPAVARVRFPRGQPGERFASFDYDQATAAGVPRFVAGSGGVPILDPDTGGAPVTRLAVVNLVPTGRRFKAAAFWGTGRANSSPDWYLNAFQYCNDPAGGYTPGSGGQAPWPSPCVAAYVSDYEISIQRDGIYATSFVFATNSTTPDPSVQLGAFALWSSLGSPRPFWLAQHIHGRPPGYPVGVVGWPGDFTVQAKGRWVLHFQAGERLRIQRVVPSPYTASAALIESGGLTLEPLYVRDLPDP